MPVRRTLPQGAVDPLVLLPKMRPLPAAQMQVYQHRHQQLVQTQQLMQQQGTTTPIPGFQYPHPQPWRAGIASTGGSMGAGMNLGPYGQSLPYLPIISIELNLQMFAEVERAAKYVNRQIITETFLLQRIRTEVYIPLRSFLYTKINTLAPKDSGRLRNALELSIAGGAVPGGNSSNTSQINGLRPFYVVLSAGNVPYAGIVNAMPTPWLQHPGVHGVVFSNRTGRTVKTAHQLNDPTAETGWYEKIANEGRQEAQRLWEMFEQSWVIPFVTPLAQRIGVPVPLIVAGLFTVVIP